MHVYARDNNLDKITIEFNGSVIGETNGNTSINLELPEGEHVLLIKATDLAGNINTSEVKIAIINTFIGLEVSCPYDGEYINATQVPVNWSISGNAENLTIIANDDVVYVLENPPSSGTVVLNLTEGNWVIVVVASMRSNRESDIITVTIDTTPPRVWTIPRNTTIETTENVTSVDVGVFAWDNFGVDMIYIMSGGTILNASGGNFTVRLLLSPRDYEFVVGAVDRAGNERQIVLLIKVVPTQEENTGAEGGGSEMEAGTGTTTLEGIKTPEGINMPLVATLLLVSITGLIVYVKKRR